MNRVLHLSPTGWIRRLLATMPQRHDTLASDRQRKLALLLLLFTLGIAFTTALAIQIYAWHPPLVPRGWVVLGFLSVGVALLLVAAGAMGWPGDLLRQVSTSSAPAPRREPPWFAAHRYHFFYPGVWLTFCAAGVLIEMTGGLVHSPFTVVLLTLLLVGQQLGRYSSHSQVHLLASLVLIGVIIITEAFASPGPQDAPPKFAFTLLAIGFLLAAGVTHADKPINPRLPKAPAHPSHLYVYLDGQGVWRYSLFYGGQRGDPALCKAAPSVVGVPREALEGALASMASHCGWPAMILSWPDESRDGGGFVALRKSESEASEPETSLRRA